MKVLTSSSAEQTRQIGAEFAKALKSGSNVLYKGEMGAGKTHFTKGIADHFGAGDVVTSPTFALVNEYEGEIPVFHFDLFRISSLDDLYAIGFFDYLDRGGVTAIEWSENIPGIEAYLSDVYTVEIRKTGDTKRTITIYTPEEAQC